MLWRINSAKKPICRFKMPLQKVKNHLHGLPYAESSGVLLLRVDVCDETLVLQNGHLLHTGAEIMAALRLKILEKDGVNSMVS